MLALVVIPTFNEAENIKPITERLLGLGLDLGVLIVDDNSPDGTGKIADNMAASDPRVMVLHRKGKLGLATAYTSGFKHALKNSDAKVLVQMDADFSHDPEVVPRLVEVAKGGALAIGSRYVKGGGTRNWGLERRIISKGGSLYARTILGVPNQDVTGGFKAWPRKVLESYDLDSIVCDGYAFQAEMTFIAYKKGFDIKEVPIIFEDRRVGQSKMSLKIAIEAVWVIWWIKLRSFFTRY
jgi:dolichol-phosphate mannosyltransferase